MQSVNGAQFLNIPSLFLSCASLAAASTPYPATAIFRLQVCMYHYNHITRL